MLPKALAGGGVAYVPQISALSQRRTSELLEPRGLTARVLVFGFLPFSEHFGGTPSTSGGSSGCPTRITSRCAAPG